ncbi:MAG: tetratricopeptide repeat protein [Firmicutes bacterium]|nr:tetratricopeptide repeat protein [Bacillota bacterium]
MTPEVEELYQAALAQLDAWEMENAEESLRKVIELDPEHARAFNKLGVIFARRGDLRQAEDCFTKAITLDDQLASAHSNLGNIYAEHGWSDRAQTAYERALALDPQNPTALHNLGVLYRKGGDIGRGIDLMKQATRSERTRFRDEARRDPKSRRTIRTGLAILIVIIVVLYFLFNR